MDTTEAFNLNNVYFRNFHMNRHFVILNWVIIDLGYGLCDRCQAITWTGDGKVRIAPLDINF